MKINFYLFIVCLGIILSDCFSVAAQPAGYKQINPIHQHYADSLKSMDYKPVFPLLAHKAYKKGFDIPLPYGISPTFFYMKQEMSFADTKIGFNDLPMKDLTEILEFGEIVNTTNVLTIRPDLWVFPFLNVYGVAGYGTSQVVVPIQSVGGKAVNFSTEQRFGVSSLGFGVTIAGGIGPVFFTIDNNMNWAKVETLDKAVPAFNLDARVGHCFVSARRPDRSVTVWLGAFMQSIEASTKGEIKLSEVILEEQVNDFKDVIENNPKIPDKIAEMLVSGLDSLGATVVHYQLSKKVSEPWNMIFGAQYQFNKHWQGRIEVGTFGKRTQFMLNLNYRFQSFSNSHKNKK